MSALPPQKFLPLTPAPKSSFLSLAPATSPSYPQKPALGPVHYGEHADEHKTDFHDVILH
ncbi:hypothetical protein RAB80_001445 [Fusarium oxysporum f. sp. vasinfectum]|nr:hypothetical protein RAB80_001445 [Fusarium oxysporum f. sp. vasinfectum]WKT39589.1 hypothetical protein QSH57_001408 [Fusarium oxysporum f. sp. vasinfectum]